MPFASFGITGMVRRLLVAVALVCACGTSQTTTQDSGDAGGEAADGPRDMQLAEVDCPDCNGSCGDGKLRVGERCDDGNTMSGDGCTQTCQVEAGWTCPTPGQLCLRM